MFIIRTVDYQDNSSYREDHVCDGVIYQEFDDADQVCDNANEELVQRGFEKAHDDWERARAFRYNRIEENKALMAAGLLPYGVPNEQPEPQIEDFRAGFTDTKIGFHYVEEWTFVPSSKVSV